MKYSLTTLPFLAGALCRQERQVLSLTCRIELPNVEGGRIDHFSAGVKGKRLFVSALGNNTVEVVNVDSGKRLRTLTDLAEPQGAYYDPPHESPVRRLCERQQRKVFDDATFHLLNTTQFSADAYRGHASRLDLIESASGGIPTLNPLYERRLP